MRSRNMIFVKNAIRASKKIKSKQIFEQEYKYQCALPKLVNFSNAKGNYCINCRKDGKVVLQGFIIAFYLNDRIISVDSLVKTLQLQNPEPKTIEQSLFLYDCAGNPFCTIGEKHTMLYISNLMTKRKNENYLHIATLVEEDLGWRGTLIYEL